jgi:hypothetical protein
MSGLLFIAANGFVLLGSAVVTGALSFDGMLDRALALVTLCMAQIILSVLLTGILLHRLSADVILAVNAVPLATLLILEVIRGRHAVPPRHLLPRWTFSRISAKSCAGADWWLLLLAMMAIGEFGWRLLIGYALPPLGFDALWYHLTTVASWIQAGKITPTLLSLWSSVYPENGEIFFAWPAILLGNDTIVNMVQLGFAVVAAVAVMGIGGSIGLTQKAAAAAGLLFFLAPVVMSESTVAYVDLIFIASFLTAFHFVLRFLRSSAFTTGAGLPSGLDLRFAALGGAAAGIALGTKSLGILYCGVLTVLLLAHLATAVVRRKTNPPAALTALSLFALPMIALGSYWYIRTWLLYGNPLYPVKVGFFGITIFPGSALQNFLSVPPHSGPWWFEVLAQWYHDFLWSGHRYYPFDARPGGFGPLWSYLAAPLLLVFVLEMIRKRPSVLVNFLFPVAVMFLVQPYRWWSRFTMVLLATGMIGLAYCVDRAPTRLSMVVRAAVIVLVAAGLWLCSAKVNQTITAGRILHLLMLPKEERTIGKVAYSSFEWVDHVNYHARIGVDITTPGFGSAPHVLFFYPLFGSHFEHHVYPLAASSESQFRTYLTTNGIDYVMVGRTGRVAELAAEAARAGCLQEVSAVENSDARAYRVDAECTARR